MAVQLEGFSIREYVSKMRTTDVGKCWPFDQDDHHHHDSNNEEILNLLPPITVTKSKWWFNELELAKSHEIIQKNLVVVGGINEKEMGNCGFEDKEEGKSNMAYLVGENEKQEMGMKSKAKAVKKRSIVEIFAVAPPIENGNEDRKKKVKKKKKKKKNKLKKEKKMGKLMKMRKKEGLIAKKEKSQKLKKQTSINFNRILYGSACNKKFSNDMLNAVCIHKKKPSGKCFSAQRKHKVLRTSKLITKHQKPTLPVRGILKNYMNGLSEEKSTRRCDMHRFSKADPCSIQQSERHVWFSGKDDILGPRSEFISSVEHSKLQSISNSTFNDISPSAAKEWCEKNNRQLAVMEVGGSDEDVSSGTENAIGDQPVTENNCLSDIQDQDGMPNYRSPHGGCQEEVDNLSNRQLSPNQIGQSSGSLHASDRGNPTILHSTSHLGSSRILFSPDEKHNFVIESQVSGNVTRDSSTCEKMIAHVGNFTPVISATSSMANHKVFLQPSTSHLAVSGITNDRIPSLSQSTSRTYNGHAVQYQPFGHLSHEELMGSLYSLPEQKQKAVLFGEKSMDEDFFGLPLNSQGELIQLNSSSKGGFNLQKKAGTLTGSSSNLMMYNHLLPQEERIGNHLNMTQRHYIDRMVSKDQFRLLPLQNYVRENPNVHALSRFALTESQGTGNTTQWFESERGGNYSRFLWEPELDQMNFSLHGCGEYDQFQNQRGLGRVNLQDCPNKISSHTTQPTMRLMGKDVTVGRSSEESQGFEDGRIWTDKEIIPEHCPVSTVPHNSVKRHFQPDWILHSASGQSREPLPHIFDTRSSQIPQSLLQGKALESHPYSSWQNNLLSRYSTPINENLSSKFHVVAHPPTSPTLLNTASNLFSSTGSRKVATQTLIPPYIPPDTCQHMLSNSAKHKYNQNLHQVTEPAFKFPFLHPDCRENVQPSWFQESSKGLPPWLLLATQEKKIPVNSSEAYSDVGLERHPCTISSVRHSPVVSYPYKFMTSHTHKQDSLASASLAHPPLIPVLPGYKPTSAINVGVRNKSKFKEKPKPKPFPVGNLGLVGKTKKRHATKSDDSIRPSKIPNLTVSKASGNSSTEMLCSAQACELDSVTDKASTAGCDSGESHKDDRHTPFGIDLSKLDDITRSGPIKLSAGAKHILKPSQSTDQDNSRLIHSTVPFAVATSSARVPESQKSTKIYRF